MAANYTTRINPEVNWGTWEGWGTSLAWWAKTFGDQDDIADILFSWGSTNYADQSLWGLALNIVRYNAGACSTVPINGETMQLSPNIHSYQQIDGYWLNWFSSDPNSDSWNWYVDAPQRNMMWKARDRGVNLFELFSNSPMWWMLNNHNPTGDPNGGNNLQPWNQQNHAVYLATIAKYAHDNWGINFQSVEPFNEPSGGWGGSWGNGQEGCHFDRAQLRDPRVFEPERSSQATVITLLRAELNKRGLGWMAVASSDENTYTDALVTWDIFNRSNVVKACVGRVNVHGYQNGDGPRDRLFSEVSASGKGLWNSEYGEGDASGLQMASNINLDFRWLHPTAWVYWQALDKGGWGLLQADGSNGTRGPVNMKYFVLAQFTRHIRPGMQIIDGGEGNTIAAYDRGDRKLIIVTTNYGTGQWINYDLSAFRGVGGRNGLVRRWATDTGGNGDRYANHDDTYLNGKLFWSWFNPNTVQSFEVENVDL